jgi:hypothetical protein
MPSIISAGTTVGTSLSLTGDTSGELQIQTNNGATTAMTLTTGGNVGIGVISPTSILDVRTSNPTRGIIASVVNTATSSQTGAQIRITQAGIEDWAFGQPAAVNAFAIWSGRSSSSDGTERMRIDSSGNVGIGTSVAPGPNGGGLAIYRSDFPRLTFRNSTTGDTTADGTTMYQIGNNWEMLNLESGYLSFGTSNTERMRITSGGQLLVNRTSFLFATPTTGGASFTGTSTSGGVPVVEIGNLDTTSGSNGAPALMVYKGSTTTDSNARFIQFSANLDGTTMGAIVGNGSGLCQFANYSDISLKKNIQPLSGSLSKIIALKPSSFDMISDNGHVNAGFIAQDVQKVYPEYVIKNMSNEGEKPLMAITGGMSGGFIAELVCAIQEQQTLIENLTTRLNALEGK